MSQRFRLLPIVLVTTALAGCGGDGNGPPTEPEDPDPTPAQVDSIAIIPDGAAIEEGDTVQLSAEVYDVSGETMTDVEVSWSSDDASIASVSESGVVTGHAKGRTSIVGTAEDVSGDAAVKVRTGATSTIDSTELSLVSDSSEIAEGVLQFEVVSGDPPDLEVGDIVVGSERGGYLRRVTEILTLSTSEVEVRTEQASLAEAVDSGSFQATVPTGSEASSATSARGSVVVGPTRAVGFSPSITATGTGLQIENHDLVSGEVCSETEDGEACADVSLTLPSGRISYQPTLDIGTTIGFSGVEEFHVIGEGNLDFDLTAELRSSAFAEFEREQQLDAGFFSTQFAVAGPGGVPVTGEVRVEFLIGYRVWMESEGEVGTGFDSDFTTELGARYVDGSWNRVFDVIPNFETDPIVADLEGEAVARVWIKPQISVVLYTVVGLNSFLEPFVEGNATFAEQCSFELLTGMDAGVGFDVEVVSFEIASYSESFNLTTETLLNEPLPCGSNNLPSVTIEAPADGSSFDEGEAITFEGSAEDTEDGPLTGEALVWSSDVDGELGTGSPVTTSSLSAGTHEITLTATDSEGETGTDNVTIVVGSGNASPSATIESPADGSSFSEGEAITFEGSADDPEEGTLTGDALVWSSDQDGEFGTGTSVTSSSLSAGTHTVTLTATDDDGAVGTDEISVTVESSDGGSGSIALADTVFGTIDPVGEVDEFTFEGQEGQEVAAFLQGLTGNISDDFELRLLDHAGTVDETVLGEDAHSDGDDESLTDGFASQSTGRVTLPRTATYTVRIQGQNSDHDSGEYRFLVHPVDRSPENRSTSITPGDTISGIEIEPPADIDEFTFEGQEGQEVAAFLQGLTGNISDDFELRLLDHAGTVDETVLGEVARSDGDDESLTDGFSSQSTGQVTLPRTATYTVRIQGQNSDHDSGEYRFLVRDESGT